MRIRKNGLIVFASISLLMLTSGCSPVVGEIPLSSASEKTSNPQAAVRGTRLCILNNSGVNMRVLWRGFAESKPVPPAAQLCSSGYEKGDTPDLAAQIEFESASEPNVWTSWIFRGNNPWIYQPRAELSFKSGFSSLGLCGQFGIGEQLGLQNNSVRGDLSRLDDSDTNVEFLLNITAASGSDFAENVTECFDPSAVGSWPS